MTSACKISVLAVVAFLFATVPATFADSTYTLELTGVGNNGVYDGIYIGPYVATVNGVANTPVICDDFSHESQLLQPWSADASTFPSLSDVRFAPGNYAEVAYLADILFGVGANNSEADALQFAIWYINDPTDVTNFLGATNPFLTDSTDIYGVQYWLNQAAGATDPSGEFADILIYTPSDGGDPQEFIVAPEPGVIVLLAIGLMGLFILKQRQRLVTTT